MKLKLDENPGERGRKMLATAGHDVSTVTLQRLESAPDEAVREVVKHFIPERELSQLAAAAPDMNALIFPGALDWSRAADWGQSALRPDAGKSNTGKSNIVTAPRRFSLSAFVGRMGRGIKGEVSETS